MADQLIVGTIVSDSEAGNIPWKWICWIHGTAQDSSGKNVKVYGTGFLVGPRLILTAAHNLFEPDKFVGYLPNAMVTPFGSQAPFGSQSVEAANGSYEINDEFFNSGGKETPTFGPSYDYGFIHLQQSFGGNDFGHFAVAYSEQDKDLTSLDNIILAGFPDEQGILWSYKGKIEDVDATQIYYKFNTIGGESGAPVFYRDTDGTFTALAIHTNANYYQGTNIIDIDSGKRITKDIKDEVEKRK